MSPTSNRARLLAAIALVASLAGVFFLGFSTADFVAHLDRQIHAVHCSFTPGLVGATTMSEAAGCKAALFSPYSSLFRTHVWGGIPVSLFGLGTYAFFAAFAIGLLLARKPSAEGTRFFSLATLFPFAATLYMAFVSATRVGALCKVCAGTYIASAVLVAAAFLLHRTVRDAEKTADEAVDPAASSAETAAMGGLRRPPPPWKPALWALELLLFVLLPAGAYAAQVPDYTKYVTSCQGLKKPDDPRHALLPVPTHAAGVQGTAATMVLDPLCPSCRALDERLRAGGVLESLDLRAVVFPLDSDCNWMLSEPVHPGACVVARALLCAGDKAGDLLSYAYAHQADLTKDPQQIFAAFPDTKSCADSPATRRRLDENLRFAVANQLPVMTPQLFLGGHAICDEDTDLGLDYALARLGVSP